MKKKTINAIISKKVKEWLKSIDDERVVKYISDKIIVTGGCITSMLLNEDVNDFDIYFKDKKSVKLVSEYYCKKFNENNKERLNKLGKDGSAWVLDGGDLNDWKNGVIKLTDFAIGYKDNIRYKDTLEWSEENNSAYKISGMLNNTTPERIKIIINSDGIAEDSDYKADESEYSIDEYLDILGDNGNINTTDNKEKYRPIFLSTNAITLSDKIQLVIRFYGEPSEIHENYDFVHVLNYWDSKYGQVELNPVALECILNKELRYVGSKYPICSLIRTRKFIKRGWQINAGQYVKMAFQISNLDLTDIYVLEDQLVGVDSIYFLNFIRNLQKSNSNNPDFKLDQDYLTTVIDKIFN